MPKPFLSDWDLRPQPPEAGSRAALQAAMDSARSQSARSEWAASRWEDAENLLRGALGDNPVLRPVGDSARRLSQFAKAAVYDLMEGDFNPPWPGSSAPGVSAPNLGAAWRDAPLPGEARALQQGGLGGGLKLMAGDIGSMAPDLLLAGRAARLGELAGIADAAPRAWAAWSYLKELARNPAEPHRAALSAATMAVAPGIAGGARELVPALPARPALQPLLQSGASLAALETLFNAPNAPELLQLYEQDPALGAAEIIKSLGVPAALAIPGIATALAGRATPPQPGAQPAAELPPPADPVYRLMTTLAGAPNAFQFPRDLSARSPEAIARQVSTPDSPVTAQWGDNALRFSTPHGYLEIQSTDPGRIEIDAYPAESQGRPAGNGKQLYQAAMAYARNNDLVADPYGSSIFQQDLSEINALRRTSAMLSSALRFGDTRHMTPADRQEVPWVPGDTPANIAALARAEAAQAAARIPWLADLSYDTSDGLIRDPAGRPWSDADLSSRLRQFDPSFDQGVGLATAKRAILTQSAPALAETHGEDFEQALQESFESPGMDSAILYAAPGGPRSPGAYDPVRDSIQLSGRGLRRLQTVLEEAAHALTARVVPLDLLRADEPRLRQALRSRELSGAARRLIAAWLLAKDHPGRPSYALSNLGEFMAGLFKDRALQDHLDRIPWPQSRQSAWHKTVQAAAVLLRLPERARPRLEPFMRASAALLAGPRTAS